MTLSRLVLFKSLGSDLNSIIIAVKMQSSKRTLRSNELMLPPSGLLDTELELHFSLQYPHFIKRDDTNRLLVMLQRRKRYKNRTILGFKTLAEGTINMSQVLQRQMDIELELMAGEASKDNKRDVVARVSVLALSSQPVDHEDAGLRHKRLALSDNADRAAADFSDDDEEFSSNEEGSDSEPMLEDAMGPRRSRKPSRVKIPVTARVSHLIRSADMDPTDIADLFDELEEMSDSGPEMDTMSISSTPKPSLRPFFSSSRSLVQAEGLAPPSAGEVPATSPLGPAPSSLHHPVQRNGHDAHHQHHHHQQQAHQGFRVAFRGASQLP
ncbi:hypothetical protein B566_EDAN004474 [Ephemera danica]|nr:hypothetical protein B566_EDAN004474 [Ephemera danica]